MTPTPKPQANAQEKLRDFIRNPKNIAKAIEGSMDKRNAVIDQANTLDEKLISMFNDLTEEQFVVRMNDLITEAEDKLLDTLQEKSKVTVVSKGVVNMESYKQGLNVARKKYNKTIAKLKENK